MDGQTQAEQRRASRTPGPGTPRIALAHEWIDQRAGSEKTFEVLAGLYPDADLYALTNALGDDFAGGRPVRTTFVSRVGPLRRHRPLALPLMPLAWRTVTREPYDIVITSSHACVKGFRPGRDALHLCYCYAPMRYVWDPHDDRGALHRLERFGPGTALRGWDRRSVRWVDDFAAISTAIQERIERTYDRPSRVIHPPVDTSFYSPGPPADSDLPFPTGEYVMACSRFIPYKRIDLAILAADRVGLPIVVAGGGPAEDQLRAMAASVSVPVVFERPSDARLRDLFRGAAAFIFPALEDFGIVAVEAQACGTPVIGLDEGGSRDTILEGLTGALAERPDVDAFAAAVKRTLEAPITAEACVSHAASFSEHVFAGKIRQWVNDTA